MTRHERREQLFKLLFRVEFNEKDEMPEQLRLYFELRDGSEDEDAPLPEDEAKEMEDTFNQILEKIPELDEKLSACSENWTLDRIGKVELSILRLAVYEILHDEKVPAGVAIDEAVELAKQFGQDGAGAFVNGVLGKMVREKA